MENKNLTELEKMALDITISEPNREEKSKTKPPKKPFFHKITKQEFKNGIKPTKRLITMSVIVVLSCIIVAETVFCAILYNDNKNSRPMPTNPSGTKKTELQEGVSALEDVSKVFGANYVYDIDQAKLEKKLVEAYLAVSDDDYAEYYTKEEWDKETASMYGNNVGIGVLVTYTDNKIIVSEVFPGSPAEASGIEVGDIIAYADDLDLSTLEYEEALEHVRGEIGSNVTIGVIRNGKRINKKITRANYNVPTVYPEIKKVNGKKIGYLRITNFYSNTYTEFRGAIEKYIEDGVQGFIFDVRDDGGGLLNIVVAMLDYVLPEGPLVRLTYKDEKQNQIINSDAEYATDLPIAVLTNGNTASAAELFTSALKDYNRATIVGTKTYGKGCGQNMFNLRNGCILKLTTFLYEPPYSDNYDGIGITPDHVVALDKKYEGYPITSIPSGEDLQLKFALNLFK